MNEKKGKRKKYCLRTKKKIPQKKVPSLEKNKL